MSRRIRRTLPRWPVWTLIALAVLLLLRASGPQTTPDEPLPQAGVLVQVVRAVDGDTLLLEGGHRVRLIGVDTPETKYPDRPAEPWGAEAAAFTQAWTIGRTVSLEFDRERVDVYRRTLAYVWVGDRLLNEELIRAGYSRAITSFPYRSDRKRLFLAAEADAREHQRGIWSGSALMGPGRN